VGILLPGFFVWVGKFLGKKVWENFPDNFSLWEKFLSWALLEKIMHGQMDRLKF
jgi:hypothetical protein